MSDINFTAAVPPLKGVRAEAHKAALTHLDTINRLVNGPKGLLATRDGQQLTHLAARLRDVANQAIEALTILRTVAELDAEKDER